jgi:hypothetical protein
MKFVNMFNYPVSLNEAGYRPMAGAERHIDQEVADQCARTNGENYLDDKIGGIYDMPIICRGEDGNVYAVVRWNDKPLVWEQLQEA